MLFDGFCMIGCWCDDVAHRTNCQNTYVNLLILAEYDMRLRSIMMSMKSEPQSNSFEFDLKYLIVVRTLRLQTVNSLRTIVWCHHGAGGGGNPPNGGASYFSQKSKAASDWMSSVGSATRGGGSCGGNLCSISVQSAVVCLC